MVKRLTAPFLSMSLAVQLLLVSAIALIALSALGYRQGSLMGLWLTSDQQGRLLFERRQFSEAADVFADPAWQGVALYKSGRYPEAADAFARLGTAEGFFNRGDAFMKGFEYRKAITAFEQAVAEAPLWLEAQENLALARYTLEYIEATREQSSTGEMEADDVVYDNESGRGRETEVNRESTLEAQSAEKWMRSVDTETAEFLRTRFLLEASRRGEL